MSKLKAIFDHCRWGKMDKAILSYKSALRINPNLRSAQENLGKLS